MFAWLKISHHAHSGRLRPHEYTSYFPLALLLVAVGLVLGVCSVSAASPPPESGYIGMTGTMPAAPPKVAATITSPSSGQHLSASPVTVTGTCPANTLVEIYKNDIFAGSGTCDNTGHYSFEIDLLFGQNVLVARVYDVLNQAGPPSNPVTVFYDALPPQAGALTPLSFGGAQLLLNTDAVYRGVFPEHAMTMPITVLGGTPPYAINIEWGDNNNTVVPRKDNLTFTVAHTYHKAGTFQITLQGTDAQGRVAFLTVAAIVNGQPTPVANTSPIKTGINKALMLWPLYTATVAVVISFWLGERREKHLIQKPTLTYHPQG